MSSSKSFSKNLLALSGAVVILFVLVLLANTFGTQFLPASMPPPLPSTQLELDEICRRAFNRCTSRAFDARIACEELIFEAGTGECYGPDGNLFDCDDDSQNPCFQAYNEDHAECRRQRRECVNYIIPSFSPQYTYNNSQHLYSGSLA